MLSSSQPNDAPVIIRQINRCIHLALSALLALLIVSGCGRPTPELAEYYYPVDQEKTYIYSLNDSLQRQYYQIYPRQVDAWRVDVYDDQGALKQRHREVEYTTGITQDKLLLYQEGVPTTAEIEANFVFPYDRLDSTEVAVHRVSWTTVDSAGLEVKYILIRNRRYAGEVEVAFDGTMYEGIALKYDERIISDQEGQLELQAEGRELYARGIGLVRRERMINDAIRLVDQLVDIKDGHVYTTN